MKKFSFALLAVAVVMAASMSAMADTFNPSCDFKQENGVYAYTFPHVKVFMGEDWYQKTTVVTGTDDHSVSFYHKGSYEAYAAEGLVGGLLFTIDTSANEDFQDLPDFFFLGFDTAEEMYYYAELPTDYQAYIDDEAIRAEYDELWSSMEDVIAKIQFADNTAKDSDVPKTISSACFDCLIQNGEATIVKYTGDTDVVEIPSEINGFPMTSIGTNAFSYMNLKSVFIPDSIHSIGRYAFDHSKISDSLVLPDHITISPNAFSYVALPSVVVIPMGATVEEKAISYCSGMEIVCIDPNATLKDCAFSYCSEMGQVICAQDSKLEMNAFSYCSDIENVILCGDVLAGENLFDHCKYAKVTTGEDYVLLKQSALNGTLSNTEHDFPKEIKIDIPSSPAVLDGVSATLSHVTAQEDPKSGRWTYTLAGTLENISDKEIERVICTIKALDEHGTQCWAFAYICEGEDDGFLPHTSVTFDIDHIARREKLIPTTVDIEITSVEFAPDPSASPLKPGELIYLALDDEKLANIKTDPPVELSFHVDQGGYGRTATFTEGAALDQALELFCAIQIGKETNGWVTDNYNSIWLTWKDGTKTGIGLNLYNLEYSTDSTFHIYKLIHLSEFWSYCEEFLMED